VGGYGGMGWAGARERARLDAPPARLARLESMKAQLGRGAGKKVREGGVESRRVRRVFALNSMEGGGREGSSLPITPEQDSSHHVGIFLVPTARTNVSIRRMSPPEGVPKTCARVCACKRVDCKRVDSSVPAAARPCHSPMFPSAARAHAKGCLDVHACVRLQEGGLQQGG
jgi:hypothetical protein